MENTAIAGREDEQMELPPGFRFHPTDEELITHYLSQKVRDSCFCALAIGEVDLNKCEPWDLPRRAKMGEKEWYFFCLRDRKYPTGLRTNRATDAGYWKATGKDKEIYKAKSLVGMKKTLVFYRGRAPKGTKTNWVMHEFRIEGKYSVSNPPKTAKNEWVICRVFEKNSGGKKVSVPGFARLSSCESDLRPTILPPLMDSSLLRDEKRGSGEMSHVTCLSSQMGDRKTQEDMMDSFNSSLLGSSSSHSDMSPASALFHKTALPNVPSMGNFHYSDAFLVQDNSILKMFLEGQGENLKRDARVELSQDSSVSNPELIQRGFDDQDPAGPLDLQGLWSY